MLPQSSLQNSGQILKILDFKVFGNFFTTYTFVHNLLKLAFTERRWKKFRERNVKEKFDKTFASTEASSGTAQRLNRCREQINLQALRSGEREKGIRVETILCLSDLGPHNP